MTRRMWTTGLAAAGCLALGTLIAALLAGARWPVLQALVVYATVVLALVAIQAVEGAAGLLEDAQVSRATLKAYDTDEAGRG